MKKESLIIMMFLLTQTYLYSQQLTGIKTINPISGDYNSFAAAIDDLNTKGVGSGGVIFNVAADAVFYDVNQTITATGTADNPVKFIKSGIGANPVIKSKGLPNSNVDFFIEVWGGDYIIFDGIDFITDPSANENEKIENVISFNGLVDDGNQYITLQNCTINQQAGNNYSFQAIEFNTQSVSNPADQTKFIEINNVTFKTCNSAISFNGDIQNNISDIVISNNQFGTASDGLTLNNSILGLNYVYNIDIHHNTFQNITTDIFVAAISGTIGIGLNQIYNNRIFNLKSTHTGVGHFELFGIKMSLAQNADLHIYNNVILDFDAPDADVPNADFPADLNLKPLFIEGTGKAYIYNNTVKISSANPNVSSIVCWGNGYSVVKNNVFVNTSVANSNSFSTIAIFRTSDVFCNNITYIDISLEGHFISNLLKTEDFYNEVYDYADIDSFKNANINPNLDANLVPQNPSYVSDNGIFAPKATMDFNDNTRTGCDIGAFEGDFGPQVDIWFPTIKYSPIQNTLVDTLKFSANITDNVGVSADPKLWFRILGSADVFTGISGVYNANSLNYVFTFPALLPGFYEYFVCAKDEAGNIISNPANPGLSVTNTGLSGNIPAANEVKARSFSYKIIKNLPIVEYFADLTLPLAWTTQNTGTGITERWSISNSTNAGSSAPELMCTYQAVNPGTTRFISPPINTVGIPIIALRFIHMFSDYAAGATLHIQSSIDLLTWTDEAWSFASGSGNKGPETVNTTIINNLNSETTYIAFVVEGDLYQFNNWFIGYVSLITVVPSVTTTAVSGITSAEATSGGNITFDGESTVTARGVCWNTNSNPTIELSTKTTDGSGFGAFTSNISGLTPGTIYYVRAYATNNAGTGYGSNISFKLGKVFIPTVSTTLVSAIKSTTATCGGVITFDGSAPVTSRGVCWSTSSNPTIDLLTKTSDGEGTGTFTSIITGLTDSTTYYIRAYAANRGGTAYGANRVFTTIPSIFSGDFANLSQWTLFGSPVPISIASIYGRNGVFDNNGDQNSNSGAITKAKFLYNQNVSITSDVYLDFSDLSGCWAGAAIGIANPAYQNWGGYDPFLYYGLTANGDACWGSLAETRRHSYLSGYYQTENGRESFGNNDILADSLANKWSTLKVCIDQDGVPSFYTDDVLIYYGSQPLASAIRTTPLPLWLGDRSSGSAGKAYHDDIKIIINDTLITNTVPFLTTNTITGITKSTAICGGKINFDGGSDVIVRGVCWSTTANPTIALNTKTTNGAGTGDFTSNISGLIAGTLYHVRAYATNSFGTSYGADNSFTTVTNPILLSLFGTENFDAPNLPLGWTTQNTGTGITERWSVSNTAIAGSASNELKCTFQQVNPGTTRIITPAIISLGVSSIALSFMHMFDDYGPGATMRIQSSNDLVTWTDETWSFASGSGNKGPETVNTTITNNLNSETTYIAFVVDGNLFQFDYWFIDLVSLTNAIPVVLTTAVSGTTSITAVSGGNITSDRGEAVTSRGVCWNTEPNPTIELITKTSDGNGSGEFISNITGLTPGTTYYVRAYATNNAGTGYGTNISFSIGAVITPTVSTNSVSAITSTKATCGGVITFDGSAPVTARGVCWSTASDPTIDLITKTIDGNGIGAFTSNITGLSDSTTYHIRAYATNSAGTAYGTDIEFFAVSPSIFSGDFGNLTEWTLFGSPLPISIATIQGRNGVFDNNGDKNYNSGAISKARFLFNQNVSITSDVYLDTSDLSGCWASAAIGISNSAYQNWGGYDPFLYYGLAAYGDACSGSLTETSRHAYLSGYYKTESGYESFGNNDILADSLADKWATLKVSINQDGIPSFYVDDVQIYYGSQPMASNLRTDSLSLWLGDRSSGSAGKAYHDWIKIILNDTVSINTIPFLTTKTITGITKSTAICGGKINFDGGSDVTVRGVCWSTTVNPTIALNTKTTNGTGIGTFISSITGLNPGTLYHARAYATNSSGTAYGNDIVFSTECLNISAFPFLEGFESGNTIPTSWKEERFDQSINWQFIQGNGGAQPASAHSGLINACLKTTSYFAVSKLISPPLNLTKIANPVLKFWHTQQFWSPDQDELRIYIKTTSSGSWILLRTYLNDIYNWKRESINLPNPSDDYYIAFEGTAKYGYGVCIDDVEVSSGNTVSLPSIISSSVSDVQGCKGGANGSVNITVSGGKKPYTFLWSNGATTEDITNLSAGNYDVVITDKDSSVNIFTFNVNEPEQIKLLVTKTDAHCDISDGSASVTVNGGVLPYKYQWETGDTDSSLINLSRGLHSITVTDKGGCKESTSLTINEIGAPIIRLNNIDSTYCGVPSGSIKIEVSGGTGNYLYQWSNNTTYKDAQNLLPGEYWVKVSLQDSSCEAMEVFSVPSIKPKPLSICLVTTDSIRNIIVWSKPPVQGAIESFLVCKWKTKDEYAVIGEIKYINESEFLDVNSDARQQAWNYKLAIKDTCGNVSLMSDKHTTIHLRYTKGMGSVINLDWGNYTGIPDISSYKIYRYSADSGLELLSEKPIEEYGNSFSDYNAPTSGEFYYVVEANVTDCENSKKAKSRNTVRSNKVVLGSTIPPINVNNLQFSKNIRLYPNPNEGEFTLNMDILSSQDVMIRVFDITGKQLLNKMCKNVHGNWKEILTLAGAQPGVYKLQIITREGICNKAFVIK